VPHAALFSFSSLLCGGFFLWLSGAPCGFCGRSLLILLFWLGESIRGSTAFGSYVSPMSCSCFEGECFVLFFFFFLAGCGRLIVLFDFAPASDGFLDLPLFREVAVNHTLLNFPDKCTCPLLDIPVLFHRGWSFLLPALFLVRIFFLSSPIELSGNRFCPKY